MDYYNASIEQQPIQLLERGWGNVYTAFYNSFLNLAKVCFFYIQCRNTKQSTDH